ncbi:hypothetical protein [Noviherbaspirillum sp.]|jgi:hypothetical protein|uniref:hypothetical protein n=1 Tax=Noviherbaspirillum sp. TaxID=1926288 RepID=UPI0025D5F3D1|nr:hypothetical protein [Noviherbaspirillum sp.]
MLKWIARRRLAAFERAFDYDASYIRDLLDTSWKAFSRFVPVMKMSSHREGLPLDAWYAAKVVAIRSEDCGPCTQLTVTMAEREGVSARLLRAVFDNDEKAMGPDVTLAVRYARAVLAHDLEADGLREQIAARWGQRAVVSLALSIAAAKVYPTMKYALGHGQACTRVHIGGTETRVAAQALPSAVRESAA